MAKETKKTTKRVRNTNIGVARLYLTTPSKRTLGREGPPASDEVCPSFRVRSKSASLSVSGSLWAQDQSSVMRLERLRLQVFSMSESFFTSSEGTWLLPVSWAELSGLVLALVERCRRVPLPMQHIRFLMVAHISSSL